MKAEALPIGAVIGEKRRFEVPIDQRTYVWTDGKQLPKFFEHIALKSRALLNAPSRFGALHGRSDRSAGRRLLHRAGVLSVLAATMESEMTLRIDVEEGAARWRELLAEVEAGRDVVIARGAETVARVTKADVPQIDGQAAIEAIFEARRGLPSTTVEEILAWRDEGRR